MFEVGFSELLLIMALALIVLGPEKLPKVASQVGRWMGRARAMARQFRETLEEEVQLEPTIRRPGTASSGTASTGSSSAPVGRSESSARRRSSTQSRSTPASWPDCSVPVSTAWMLLIRLEPRPSCSSRMMRSRSAAAA